MIKALFFVLTLISFGVNAATYYVKTTGNDSNTGLSDAQAFRTVAKVNSLGCVAGDDVYFKAGSTWSEQLIIDCSGTVGNRTIVGSYYMNGATEVHAAPTDGTPLPILRGTYPLMDEAGAIPSSQYAGLISIQGNYITVQNFRIEDSSGRGISSPTGTFHDNIIEYNEVHNVATQTIAIMRNSYDNTMRYNVASGCALAWRDGKISIWPACLHVVRSTGAEVYGNVTYNNYGEGIGIYQGSSNAHVYDNVVSVRRTVGIYTDQAINTIIEDNIVTGMFTNAPTSNVNAIGVTTEAGYDDTTGAVVRNNLIANVNKCFWMAVLAPATAAGKKAGAKILGNTCVHATQGYAFTSAASELTELVLENNIFHDISGGANSCVLPTGAFTSDYNYWPNIQNDADCASANDIIGGLLLNKTTGWDLVSESNIPSVSDFTPQTGEAVIGGGITHASLTTDYNGDTRSSPPSIGAIDVAVTAPTEVTVPYYMNVGAGQVVVSKTYLAEADRVPDTSPSSWLNSRTGDILGTTDDEVYRTTRSKNGSIVYNIPIANGDYDVKLLGIEGYYGISAGACTVNGSDRGFSASAEGTTYTNSLDWCIQAGAAMTAGSYTMAGVTVSDGSLDVVVGAGAGIDPQATLSAIEVTVAAPAVNTLTVGNASPTYTTTNQYPIESNIDYVSICQISTTATTGGVPNDILASSINTVGITSGTVTFVDPEITYLPASAAIRDAVGSFIVTVGDGVESDTCTISISLTGGKKLEFTVFDDFGVELTSTTGWSLCWTTYGTFLSETGIKCSSGEDQTTDSAGVMRYYDDRLPTPGVGVFAYYFLMNNSSITGTDGAKVNRDPRGRAKVTQ